MKTRIIRNATALIGIALLATSCIEVGNVEEAWKDAKADPALLGFWKGNDDSKCAFIKTEKDFYLTSGTNGLEGGCKSFETNGHKYIIVASLQPTVLGFGEVDEDSKNGTLLRYEVKGDTLTMYSLDGEVITAAIKAKKVPGELDEEGDGSLTILDDQTIKWFGEIAEGDGWNPTVFKRVK